MCIPISLSADFQSLSVAVYKFCPEVALDTVGVERRVTYVHTPEIATIGVNVTRVVWGDLL